MVGRSARGLAPLEPIEYRRADTNVRSSAEAHVALRGEWGGGCAGRARGSGSVASGGGRVLLRVALPTGMRLVTLTPPAPGRRPRRRRRAAGSRDDRDA